MWNISPLSIKEEKKLELKGRYMPTSSPAMEADKRSRDEKDNRDIKNRGTIWSDCFFRDIESRVVGEDSDDLETRTRPLQTVICSSSINSPLLPNTAPILFREVMCLA